MSIQNFDDGYNQDYNYNQKSEKKENSNEPLNTQVSIVLFCALAALICLAIGVVIYVTKASGELFVNSSMSFNTLTQFVLLAAGAVFFVYYFVFYKNKSGERMVPLTFILLGTVGTLGVINVITTITSAGKGVDVGKLFMNNLPTLVTPLISAILFFLVAKNFGVNTFNKITYSVALGFVLAPCPATVVQYLSALSTSTSSDNSAIIFALLIALGQAFLYAGLLVFGVLEYYDKSK